MAPKVRLDALLVDRGLAASRERAQALILAGQVTVKGQMVAKAGAPVAPDAEVALSRPTIRTWAAAASSWRTRSTPSASIRRDGTRSTSARRPAASPTCCCSAAPPA